MTQILGALDFQHTLMRAQDLSLSLAFEKAKNLGDLTAAWLRHVKASLQERDFDPKAKLQVGDVASLVAPAALVATIVRDSGLPIDQGPVRVQLIGSDPLIRFDHSVWASMAGEMLECPGNIEIVLNISEEALTAAFPIAEALGLKKCSVIAHAEIPMTDSGRIDLALWVHPAGESSESAEADNRLTAERWFASSVPVYATSFNEIDVYGQNYLLNQGGLELHPLGGELTRGSRAINRFGISTSGLGVEGGWSAIISKLGPASHRYEEIDLRRVTAALRMYCLEGAIHNSWTLGQFINGVAFNRVLPVGLIGNLAIDPKTGHLVVENSDTRELTLAGHLWGKKLETMPASSDKKGLLLWACDVKLAFMTALPKEEKRRAEAIQILKSAFNDGVIAAGVGLARAYDISKVDGSKDLALALFKEIGHQHPLSAYRLAYEAYGRGDVAAAETHFRASADYGYPIAQTDLGKLLGGQERVEESVVELHRAAKACDPEANFLLGELAAKSNELQSALDLLRQAWQYGHAEAAALAQQIAAYMLENNLGKRPLIKREFKEVSSYLKKLATRTVPVAKPTTEKSQRHKMAEEVIRNLTKPGTRSV